jgi:hypothetical protein
MINSRGQIIASVQSFVIVLYPILLRKRDIFHSKLISPFLSFHLTLSYSAMQPLVLIVVVARAL